MGQSFGKQTGTQTKEAHDNEIWQTKAMQLADECYSGAPYVGHEVEGPGSLGSYQRPADVQRWWGLYPEWRCEERRREEQRREERKLDLGLIVVALMSKEDKKKSGMN